jgi:hypothetical protein
MTPTGNIDISKVNLQISKTSTTFL